MTLNERKELKIASGTILLNDRVRSRLLGKHKFDAKELFTLRLLVSTLVRLEVWFHG